MINEYGYGVKLETSDPYLPTTGFNKKGYDDILNDIIHRAQEV